LLLRLTSPPKTSQPLMPVVHEMTRHLTDTDRISSQSRWHQQD
jgi:hypothetical protein